MTPTIELNAEIYRAMSVIAEDEALLRRVLKYVKKLAAQKQDAAQMTEEEFFARVEEAEEQYRQGQYTTMMPGESVEDMLRRSGYDV